MSQNAILGENITWTSSGTSDTLVCENIDPNKYNGVQISAAGVTLESATITVTLPSGNTHVAAAPTGSGNYALIGQGAKMSKITLSNVAAGSYVCRFTQI